MDNTPHAATSLRLFIGLLPDVQVRDAVLDWRARWGWPRGAALSAPAHLHLTLFFLGETEAARLPALCAALDTVTPPRLRLRLGRPEAWARGLWVLRPSPCAELDDLHRRMGVALADAGFAAAREGEVWKPHLTLARKASGARPPADEPALDWNVDGFALVWSRLPPAVPRARYEVLRGWGDGVPPAFTAPVAAR